MTKLLTVVLIIALSFTTLMLATSSASDCSISMRARIAELEQKKLTLESALTRAVQRGVNVEAQLILCREGRLTTQQ